MNDKRKKPNRKPEPPEQEHDAAFVEEMAELKRDMRSAKLVDWAQNNQQQLIAGVVAVVLILGGATLWVERNKSQKESAAILYHQALSAPDEEKKIALLEMVTKDYTGSGYALLAHLYMAKSSDSPEDHLNALIHGSASTPALAWQARLDLAEIYLNSDRASEVTTLLAEPVGRQYEQLRHYLLAEAATDDGQKQVHLQKSLDAESNDSLLKARVERMLSDLSAGVSSSS